MRTITVALVVALLVAVASATLLNDANMINRINSHPKSSWTAKAHSKFDGMTLEHAKKMLGTFLPVKETFNLQRYNPKVRSAVPTNFNAIEGFPGCIGPIRDQAHCGSCWAVSGAEVMADRFCIARNKSQYIEFSPNYILSCDDSNYGCDGGYLSNQWRFLSTVGTTTEECDPYTAGEGEVEACPSTCKDGSDIKLYKVDPKTVKLFDTHNIEAIQEDIVKYGTVQMGFRVYQDFFNYHSGVYRHLSGGLAGGHAVKYVGWGVDTKTNLPYWIAANSWGEDWGMNGFFWILRGSNECDCEAQVYSARAML